jgi:hypothetical protein
MRYLAIIAALLAALAVDRAHQSLIETRAEFPRDADLLYLPAPQHLRLMSLGYREALADLIWIRALIFAGSHITDEQLTWSDYYVEAVTDLSPRFHRPYLWGGITAIYSGASTVDRSAVERAAAIYRRGLDKFPESHELHYTLAMLLLHQAPSTPGFSPAELAELKKEGVEAIRKAAAFGAGPLVRRYAATLITEQASSQMAIQFLENQLLEAEDPTLRRTLQNKLRKLAGQEASQAIEELRRSFLTERDAANAAYVPDTLWAVIRPAPAPLD